LNIRIIEAVEIIMAAKFRVVFVLGGPGSGKGTQSLLIERKFKFKHLSAG
jgi:UMP-CMP kinase